MINKKTKYLLYSYFTDYSQTSIKKIIFGVFILIFTILITHYFLIEKSFSQYVYSEWLVNYAGGFVRRGLPGTIIFWLREKFNLNNDQMYFMVVYFNYLIFLLWSIIYLIKVNKSLKVLTIETILIFLFLPSLIIFGINDLGTVGRKEYLFIFGLLINLWLVSRTVDSLYLDEYDEDKEKLNSQNINKYSYSVFIIYNLFSIPSALSHEALLFLVLPLNLIITINLLILNQSPVKAITKTLIIYSPTILICLISVIFKGNQDIVINICKSWEEYQLLLTDCNKIDGVLLFYDYSTLKVINDVFRFNVLDGNGLKFLAWITVFLLNTIILLRASKITIIKSVEDENRKLYIKGQNINFSPQDISISFSFKYICVPFLLSVVLYIIAYDWGRWFMIISSTYAICILTPNLIKLEMYLYDKKQWLFKILKPIYKLYFHIFSLFQNKFDIRKYYLVYLIVLIYTLFFIRIPVIDMNSMNFKYALIIRLIIRLFKKFLLLF